MSTRPPVIPAGAAGQGSAAARARPGARGRRGACLLAATCLALPAAAQPPPSRVPLAGLPGLGAQDPRRTVDPTAEPWTALGRVQLEVGGRCTGVLIAPRLVLTAAHCLVARRARNLVQPASIHFLLGYHLGRHEAHARVVSYRVGAGFIPGQPGPAAADWALLTLDSALPAGRALPLLRETLPPRTALMLGGYQQDRPEVILADTGCRALGLRREAQGGPMLVHDCAATRGTSGAPLLVQGPGGDWAVAGVASRSLADVALGAAVPASAIPVRD